MKTPTTKLTKSEFQDFIRKNDYETEYWRYITPDNRLHTDFIESVEGIMPNETGDYLFDYEIMDRDRYNATILANSGVDAKEFMGEDERILVIVQSPEWIAANNWAIIAHCDPYNAKSHYHGERVVKFDGATPVSWVLKEFSTKTEAIERLEKFFKGDYEGEIDFYESESAARKDLEDMGIEQPDTTFWKGAGYYHTESKELIFRKGDESYSFDTLSYYIDQI